MTETELPSGWAWAKLGDVGSEWRERVDPHPETDYELWSVPAFADGKPERCKGHEIRSSKISTQRGDVLVCKINPRINRVWQTKAPLGAIKQIASPEWLVLRLPERDKEYLSAYLRWYLSSPDFRATIMSRTSGVTGSHTRVKANEILNQSVPIPPLAEQKRIVDALEGHLSRLDAADEVLISIGRRAATLRLSALANVFQRESDGLEYKKLGDIADVRLGRQRSPKNHTGDQMKPYVRAANVGWSGMKLDDVKEMNFNDKEVSTYELKSGDILMNEASGSPGEVGKPAMWNGEISGCCFQNTLIRLRPMAVDPQYLYNFMWFEAARGAFRDDARGVGIHHLGSSRVAKWLIPYPSRSEQRRIVAYVNAVISDLNRFHKLVDRDSNVRRCSAALRRSLLNHAFSGKLVPQDPDDEPASVLLERIRAQREAQPVPKRQRRAKKTTKSANAGSTPNPERPAPPVSSEPCGRYVQEELWK